MRSNPMKLSLIAGILFFVCSFTLNAVPVRYTVGGKIAAINEVFLTKATHMLMDGDTEGLQELEKAFLIMKLKPRQDVEIVKTSEEDDEHIKILLIDAGLELWTTKDAVKLYTTEELKKKGVDTNGQDNNQKEDDSK